MNIGMRSISRLDELLTSGILAFICLFIVVGFYIAGFWPFSFIPANHVQRLQDRPGIRLERHGIAYTINPLVLPPPSATGAASCTFELWLEPEVGPYYDVPHILTIYNGSLPESLVIGQWRSGLLIRKPATGRTGNYQEVGADGVFKKGQPTLITITADVLGTAFYKDGALIRRFPQYALRPEVLTGNIILGNSATGSGSTWNGKFFGLAIYARALSSAEVKEHHSVWTGAGAERLSAAPGLSALYLFDERDGPWIRERLRRQPDLFIPAHYRVLLKTVLGFSWHEIYPRLTNRLDIAINVAGFMPFGFFFFLYLNKTGLERRALCAILTVLAGAGLSLSIEIIQAYLPVRYSSLTDLACNILGTLIGIPFVALIPQRTRAAAGR